MNQIDFIRIINPFKDKLFRLAKRLLISTEEAEDATQEIIFKLWNNNKNLEKYNNIEAFAVTMTKNYCLDQLKSKRANNLQIVDYNLDNNQTNLQTHLEAKDSLEWVNKIMNNLPEQQKLVLQLRDIEQYDYDEIAKIMDMNPTAVRVALSRGRKTVREFLTKTHDYGTK